jgi:MFS family permease
VTSELRSSRRGGVARSLRYPAFRRLWAAAVLLALPQWMERLAVGWFVLDTTGSVFLAALSFAVQNIPGLILGPFAGAVSDRVYRPRVLRVVWAARGLALLAIAGVVGLGGTTALLLVFVALSGCVRTFEVPAVQTLIADLVAREDHGNATGMYSVGVRGVGAVGALTGGLIIDAFGPVPVFLLASMLPVAGIRLVSSIAAPQPAATAHAGVRGVWVDTARGLSVMLRLPMVASLIALAIVVEIFGFAYNALLPAIADHVLEVDASGLGALAAAASIGSVGGSLVVSAVGDAPRRGRVVIGVTLVFGAAIVAFGANEVFGIALVLAAAVGATATMFDALQWVLLQAHVPDELRGRVIGAWVWAIGFGWIGHLGLGALGDLVGVQAAVITAGAVVVAVGLLAAASPRLRSA